jgi:FkbM family methyltransferase
MLQKSLSWHTIIKSQNAFGMKKVLRSVQTLFPFLHDARFLLKSLKIKAAKVPAEHDFNALKLFKPNPEQVFIDVGANRGVTVLSMLLFKNFGNKIIGFEPNPLVFEKLKRNRFIRHNRVVLHNYGLSSANRELTLFIPFYRKWMFDGLSSFHYAEAEDWLKTRLWGFDGRKLRVEKVNCQVRKLDDFQLEPYFIKIDVQGHEMEVLKGGEQTISKHKPVLLVESISEAIMQYLTPIGYRFYSYIGGQFSEGTGKLNTFCITGDKMAGIKGEND